MYQSSMIEMSAKVSHKENAFCSKIDTTFFNPPVSFDKIYDYLKSSFQSMAFIQKGFYCTICDGKNQDFIMQQKENSRLTVGISQKSCTDLVYRFKEFILYKVYYLDPFMVNANYLYNCMENTDQYSYKPEYNSHFMEVKECLENGGDCTQICNDFRLGGMSELFLGDLKKYEVFYENFNKFLKIGNVEEDSESEIIIPEYSVNGTDFFVSEHELSLLEQQELNAGHISSMEIHTSENGIDIFEEAKTANYYLMDQYANIEKNRIYNTNPNDENNSLMAHGFATQIKDEHKVNVDIKVDLGKKDLI